MKATPMRDLKGREMPKNGRVQKGILKRLRIQTVVALALALLSLPFGAVAAYSSLFGSVTVFVPGLLFTVLVTGKIGADSVEFLRTAVLAEVGKLALVGVFCAVVFIFVKPLAGGFFFLGMIGVLAAGWLGLAFLFRD